MSVINREFSVVYEEIEDGWIMARVPELPGAVTQGKDLEEAKENIKEAIELLLESYRDHAATTASPEAVWGTVTIDVPAQ
jgi:predicted RNase H-like HicB family nuclease